MAIRNRKLQQCQELYSKMKWNNIKYSKLQTGNTQLSNTFE